MALYWCDESGEAPTRGIRVMSPEKQARAIVLHERGVSIAKIAAELGVWPNSVTWMLKRGLMLERERQRRREDGRTETQCSKCGVLGHNAMSCGVARPRAVR